jgi:UDP-N-acetyl-D-mannosaminuronic acid dehydrogenase
MNITIFALGRTGLPLSLICADSGFKVIGIDINKNLIEQIKKGITPFHEPGLKRLLDKHLNKNFFPTTKIIEEVKESEYYIVAIGTKFNKYPEKASLTNLYKIVRKIYEIGIKNKTIIFRVTLPLGTTDKIKKIFEKDGLIEGKDFYLAFVPERLMEGKAINEEKNLPKIIGCYSDKGFEKVKELFKRIGGDIIKVANPKTAEFVKLIDNSWRNLRFAFANEIAYLSEVNGINVMEVLRAANCDYERNEIPFPGPVSGYCLGKDPYLLEMAFDKVIVRGFNSVWFYARLANDWLCKKIVKEVQGENILVAGLSYKENIDDYRNGHSLEIIELLLNEDLNVIVTDPYLDKSTYTQLPKHIDKNVEKMGLKTAMKKSDTIIFSTAHKEFREINIKDLIRNVKKGTKIIDLWNIFEGKLEYKKDINYVGFGRGDLRLEF